MALALVCDFQLYLLQDYIHLPQHKSATELQADLNLLSAAAVSLGILLAGVACDHYKKHRMIVTGATVGVAVSFLVPVILPTLSGMWIFSSSNGFAFGCWAAVDTVLVAQIIPDTHSTGRDLGILNIAGLAPQLISPLLSAALIIHCGGYRTLLIVGCLVALVSAFANNLVRGAS